MPRTQRARISVLAFAAAALLATPASAVWLMKWKDTVQGEYKDSAVAMDCTQSPRGQTLEWIDRNCRIVGLAQGTGQLEVIDLGVIPPGSSKLLSSADR